MHRSILTSILIGSFAYFAACGGDESRTAIDTQTDTTETAVVSQTVETTTLVPLPAATGSVAMETAATTMPGAAVTESARIAGAPSPVKTGALAPRSTGSPATPSSTPAVSVSVNPTPSQPTAAATPAATSPPPPAAASSSSATEGASIFASKCQSCHGPNGNAQTAIAKKNQIPAFSSSAVQSMPDDELASVIRQGKGSVSAAAHRSKHLTDAQVQDVIAWIRTLK